MKKNDEVQVVLFGRTNVGKSTLFNCLIERQQALVSDTAGTTRDSNSAMVSWRNLNFKLIDTAGVIEEKILRGYLKKDEFDVEQKVQSQIKDHLKNADLILFIVDARDGLLKDDRTLARELQKIKKPILLVANKSDNPRIRKDAVDFNRLGMGEPLPVSAASGSGTGDLLDEIFEIFKDRTSKEEIVAIKPDINITVLGKPNVGKSSLINKLCGENKQIVSHLPHTTREPNDIVIEWKNYNLRFIDTAGMHRKGFKSVKKLKQQEKLERLSISKSLQTLQKADIALLVVDIADELTQQEAKIYDAITKNKCSLIIVANKWDAVEERDTKKYTNVIYSHFPYATWAPIQFISALSGEKINHLMDLILEVNENRRIELNDNATNKFLKQILKHHRPVKSKGTKKPYVHQFIQTQACPPKFTMRIGSRDSVHDSYVRFVENQLRQKFGFKGTPITIYIEKNKAVHGQHEQFLIDQGRQGKQEKNENQSENNDNESE